MARVSIVIPVYNVAPYLRECLDSVLMQTFRGLEIICVDDGSTDGSSAILDTYEKEDNRIRVIRQPNEGLSAARNAGMDAATGTYLYFLDSDDMLASNAMERLHGLAEAQKLDQILFGTELVAGSDHVSEIEVVRMRRYYDVPQDVAGRATDGAKLFSQLIEKNAFFASVPLRFFRRTSIPQDLRFPVGILHEDNYFSPLALLAAHQAIAIPDKLYRRRIREGSITTATGTELRHAEGLLEIYHRLVRARLGGRIPKNARGSYRTFLRTIYRNYLRYAGVRPIFLRPLDFLRGHGLFAPFIRRMKKLHHSFTNASVQ